MIFTVFDIETTGLSTSFDNIIQFAYAQFDSNLQRISADCLYFCFEGMPWSKEAEDVHHIPLSSLLPHTPSFTHNLRKMYQILYYGNLVGHNIEQFDFPFCRSFLSRNGLPDIVPSKLYDTMLIYKSVFKKRVKLSAVQEHCRLTPANVQRTAERWFGGGDFLHDARFDVVVTALAFIAAVRKGLV